MLAVHVVCSSVLTGGVIPAAEAGAEVVLCRSEGLKRLWCTHPIMIFTDTWNEWKLLREH